MKKTPTALKWYQNFSKFTPASCRYYPTCSEYAKWLFIFDNKASATLKSAKRIVTCNQLFPGGIDYPSINYKPPRVLELHNIVKRDSKASKPFYFKPFNSKLRIEYWLVPTNKKYYITKDFNASATYLPAGYAPTR